MIRLFNPFGTSSRILQYESVRATEKLNGIPALVVDVPASSGSMVGLNNSKTLTAEAVSELVSLVARLLGGRVNQFNEVIIKPAS